MDVNETVPEDENELDMLTSAQSTRSSGVKVYDHVPPRVDMDKYQADIPPLLNAQSSKVSYESNLKSALYKADTDWYSGTRKVSTCDASKQTKINDFIAFARNYIEPTCIRTSNGKNTNNDNIALESDGLIIEYLAKHNYDIEYAKLHFISQLSFGKDAVGAFMDHSIVPPSDRISSSALYLQHRDKSLISLKNMLGLYRHSNVYQTPFLNSTLTSSSNDSHIDNNQQYQLLDTNYYNIPINAASSAPRGSLEMVENAYLYRYNNSSSCTNSDHGEEISGDMNASACATLDRRDSFELALLNMESISNFDPADVNPTDIVCSPTNAHGNNTTSSTVSGRPARAAANITNIVEKERDSKLKWKALYQRGLKIVNCLNKISSSSASAPTADTNANTTASGGAASSTVAASHSTAVTNTRLFSDAHALLLESVEYPLYTNAIGEENTSHAIYTCMGDLLKAWLKTREWIAEVNDALCLCYGSSEHINYLPNAVTNKTCTNCYGYGPVTGAVGKIHSPVALGNNSTEDYPKTPSLSNVSPFTSADTTAFNAELKRLLSEAYYLPLFPSREVQMVKKILSERDEFLNTAKVINNSYRDSVSVPPVAVSVANTTGSARVAALAATNANTVETVRIAWTTSPKYPNLLGKEELSSLSKQIISLLEAHVRIPLYALNALLNYSNRIPHGIVHKQLYPLVNVYNEAMAVTTEIDEFLDSCTWLKLNRRKYNKAENNENRGLSLYERILQLQQKASTFPVIVIPRLEELNHILETTLNWKNNVQEVAEATTTVSLQRVEALLAESDSIPFEFPNDMEVLKVKRQLAKQWLEKLKKSFANKTRTAVPRRNRDDSSAASSNSTISNQNKLKLSDMKEMIAEGELLFQAEASGNEGGASGNSTNHRELNRAMSVVEVAEEWLNQVKESLHDICVMSMNGMLKRTVNPKPSVVNPEVKTCEVFEKDESVGESEVKVETDSVGGDGSMEEVEEDTKEEEGEEGDVELFIEELEELLSEADSMPVHIEDAVLLRAQLNIIKWARRVRPYLPMERYLYSIQASEQTQSETHTDPNDPDSPSPIPVFYEKMQEKMYTYAELQSIIKELNKIKAHLPSNVKNQNHEISITPGGAKQKNKDKKSISYNKTVPPEEVIARQLLEQVDHWMVSSKRILSGFGTSSVCVKKGTKLSTIRSLLHKVSFICVDMSKECIPFVQELTRAENWVKQNAMWLSILLQSNADSFMQVETGVLPLEEELPWDHLVFDLDNSDNGSGVKHSNRMKAVWLPSSAYACSESNVSAEKVVEIVDGSVDNMETDDAMVVTTASPLSCPCPRLTQAELARLHTEADNEFQIEFDEINYLYEMVEVARSWCEQVNAAVRNITNEVFKHHPCTLYNIHTGEPLVPLLHDIYSCISSTIVTSHHNYGHMATTTTSTYNHDPTLTNKPTEEMRCPGTPIDLIKHGASVESHVADLKRLHELKTEYRLDCIETPEWSMLIDESIHRIQDWSAATQDVMISKAHPAGISDAGIAPPTVASAGITVTADEQPVVATVAPQSISDSLESVCGWYEAHSADIHASFPCNNGTKEGETDVPQSVKEVEKGQWKHIEEIMERIQAQIEYGLNVVGVSHLATADVALYLGILHWCQSARRLVSTDTWGDVQTDCILNLLKDSDAVLTADQLLEYAQRVDLNAESDLISLSEEALEEHTAGLDTGVDCKLTPNVSRNNNANSIIQLQCALERGMESYYKSRPHASILHRYAQKKKEQERLNRAAGEDCEEESAVEDEGEGADDDAMDVCMCSENKDEKENVEEEEGSEGVEGTNGDRSSDDSDGDSANGDVPARSGRFKRKQDEMDENRDPAVSEIKTKRASALRKTAKTSKVGVKLEKKSPKPTSGKKRRIDASSASNEISKTSDDVSSPPAKTASTPASKRKKKNDQYHSDSEDSSEFSSLTSESEFGMASKVSTAENKSEVIESVKDEIEGDQIIQRTDDDADASVAEDFATATVSTAANLKLKARNAYYDRNKIAKLRRLHLRRIRRKINHRKGLLEHVASIHTLASRAGSNIKQEFGDTNLASTNFLHLYTVKRYSTINVSFITSNVHLLLKSRCASEEDHGGKPQKREKLTTSSIQSSYKNKLLELCEDCKHLNVFVRLLLFWRGCVLKFWQRCSEVKEWKSEVLGLLHGTVLKENSEVNKLTLPGESVVGETAASDVDPCVEVEQQVRALLAAAETRALTPQLRVNVELQLDCSEKWTQEALSIMASKGVPNTAIDGTAAGADGVIPMHPKPSLEELKVIVKRGENLLFPRNNLTKQLRHEYKRAREWLIALEKSGIEDGLAKMDDLEVLLPQSDNLVVDVMTAVDAIEQVTKTYCLCRQPYHGEMIGCDNCDEWYHFHCVGLTKAKAEQTTAYQCIRCGIESSLKSCASTVAHTINRWMYPQECMKNREAKRQKNLKRVLKEEKDYDKIQAEVKQCMAKVQNCISEQNQLIEQLASLRASGSTTTTAAETSTAMEGMSNSLCMTSVENSSEVVEQANTEEVPVETASAATSIAPPGAIDISDLLRSKLTSITTSIAEFELLLKQLTAQSSQQEERVLRAKKEESDYSAVVVEEYSKKSVIVEWMLAMQGFLWPETQEEYVLGVPKVSDCGYLPIGLRSAIECAQLSNISHFDDVIHIIESFLWMNWCNYTLAVLRGPPNTSSLKFLIALAAPLKYADDKFIKALRGILTRASAWKTKTRKYLNAFKSGVAAPNAAAGAITAAASKKREKSGMASNFAGELFALSHGNLDFNKLSSHVVDGSSIPFSSKLKKKMKALLDKTMTVTTEQQNLVDSGKIPAPVADVEDKPKKKGPKKVDHTLGHVEASNNSTLCVVAIPKTDAGVTSMNAIRADYLFITEDDIAVDGHSTDEEGNSFDGVNSSSKSTKSAVLKQYMKCSVDVNSGMPLVNVDDANNDGIDAAEVMVVDATTSVLCAENADDTEGVDTVGVTEATAVATTVDEFIPPSAAGTSADEKAVSAAPAIKEEEHQQRLNALPPHATVNIAYARPPVSLHELVTTPQAPWSTYLVNIMKLPWLYQMCWEEQTDPKLYSRFHSTRVALTSSATSASSAASIETPVDYRPMVHDYAVFKVPIGMNKQSDLPRYVLEMPPSLLAKSSCGDAIWPPRLGLLEPVALSRTTNAPSTAEEGRDGVSVAVKGTDTALVGEECKESFTATEGAYPSAVAEDATEMGDQDAEGPAADDSVNVIDGLPTEDLNIGTSDVAIDTEMFESPVDIENPEETNATPLNLQPSVVQMKEKKSRKRKLKAVEDATLNLSTGDNANSDDSRTATVGSNIETELMPDSLENGSSISSEAETDVPVGKRARLDWNENGSTDGASPIPEKDRKKKGRRKKSATMEEISSVMSIPVVSDPSEAAAGDLPKASDSDAKMAIVTTDVSSDISTDTNAVEVMETPVSDKEKRKRGRKKKVSTVEDFSSVIPLADEGADSIDRDVASIDSSIPLVALETLVDENEPLVTNKVVVGVKKVVKRGRKKKPEQGADIASSMGNVE